MTLWRDRPYAQRPQSGLWDCRRLRRASREQLLGLSLLAKPICVAENQKLGYACLMENPALPRDKLSDQPLRRGGDATKRLAKKHLLFMPRNSLKSLDSDERIQGNPRKSNPDNLGFS
jgi:hypothetical protein